MVFVAILELLDMYSEAVRQYVLATPSGSVIELPRTDIQEASTQRRPKLLEFMKAQSRSMISPSI